VDKMSKILLFSMILKPSRQSNVQFVKKMTVGDSDE
jgi:hypothetical protein